MLYVKIYTFRGKYTLFTFGLVHFENFGQYQIYLHIITIGYDLDVTFVKETRHQYMHKFERNISSFIFSVIFFLGELRKFGMAT
jgi:hypothetical protein